MKFIDCNNIGPNGASLMALALENNTTILKLKLSIFPK